MKLDRLPEYVFAGTVTLIGMIFALYCGQLTGAGQTKTLTMIFAGLGALFVALKMQQRIWLFVPACWTLGGQMPILSIPVAVRDIVVLVVFAAFLGFKAFRLVKLKPKYELLDVLLIVNIAYLVSVYLRNPVGTDAIGLGTGRVGGRPYFTVVIALLAYWILNQVTVGPKQVRAFFFWMLSGTAVVFVLGVITHYFPDTVPVIGAVYNGIDTGSYNTDTLSDATLNEEGRHQYMAGVAPPLICALVSYFSPLTLFFPTHPFRFALFALGIFGTLQSGHRTAIMDVALVVTIAMVLKKQYLALMRIAFFAIPTIVIVLALHGTLYEFPIPIQRTLTFLPGNWNYQAVDSANTSTEWRVQMWEWIFEGNKYIQNRTLGDGFGFTMREYAAMMEAAELRIGGDTSQENMMINGGVHNGPISTIRYVGFVGLVFYSILILYMVKYAFALIRSSRGTPYFSLALFVGLPVITLPVFFFFIVGGFDSNLPESIFSLGLLKLVSRSLQEHVGVVPKVEQPRPEPRRPVPPMRGRNLIPA